MTKFYINPETGKIIKSTGKTFKKLKKNNCFIKKDWCLYDIKTAKKCFSKILDIYPEINQNKYIDKPKPLSKPTIKTLSKPTIKPLSKPSTSKPSTSKPRKFSPKLSLTKPLSKPTSIPSISIPSISKPTSKPKKLSPKLSLTKPLIKLSSKYPKIDVETYPEIKTVKAPSLVSDTVSTSPSLVSTKPSVVSDTVSTITFPVISDISSSNVSSSNVSSSEKDFQLDWLDNKLMKKKFINQEKQKMSNINLIENDKGDIIGFTED